MVEKPNHVIFAQLFKVDTTGIPFTIWELCSLLNTYEIPLKNHNGIIANPTLYCKFFKSFPGNIHFLNNEYNAIIQTMAVIAVKRTRKFKKLTKNLTSVTQTKSVIRSGSLRICSFRKLTTDIVEPIMTMMKDGIKNLLKIK